MKVAITCKQLIRDIDAWREPLADAGLELVLPEVSGQHLEGAELVAALEGCGAVIAGDDRFSDLVISQLPDLRVLVRWGSGIDGVDLEAARLASVKVRNTPGMFNNEVADVTIGYLIMLARQLVNINEGVHDGGWPKPAGKSLNGSVLGIVGLGGIGRAVASRALSMQMRVIGFDPNPASAEAAQGLGVLTMPLSALWSESDFVSINCPLNPETHHLVDWEAVKSMKDGVYIVNTGRGAVVDQNALVRGLDSGKIGGAALDVLEVEPPSPGSPLLGRSNVILGSHNASNTFEASARTHAAAIETLLGALGDD